MFGYLLLKKKLIINFMNFFEVRVFFLGQNKQLLKICKKQKSKFIGIPR